MSSEEIEKTIRDHAEFIRTLQADATRTQQETILAIRSLHERLSKSHEYQLKDSRMNLDAFQEALHEVVKKLEDKSIVCAEHDTAIALLQQANIALATAVKTVMDAVDKFKTDQDLARKGVIGFLGTALIALGVYIWRVMVEKH